MTGLRDLAREAMLACGARGFVRFAREGDALLVCDAASRCKDGGDALFAALSEAGVSCRMEGALLMITPGDALLARLCAGDMPLYTDWDDPLHPAQALALRLVREAAAPLTPSGRMLVLATARLLWQPRERVLAGLPLIRAMAAQRMREGDRNGFYEAGRLLGNWCCEQKKGSDAK